MKAVLRLLVPTTVLVSLLSSCSPEYHGVHPTSPLPPSQLGSDPRTVDSLRPTLCWRTGSDKGTRYDLILYAGIRKELDLFSAYYMRGEEVYYREGIEGGSHRIERPLKSNTVYVWGVRTRSGTNVGPWSTYYCQTGYVPIKYVGSRWADGLWWAFRTPKQ
jgi:hypothetical protein